MFEFLIFVENLSTRYIFILVLSFFLVYIILFYRHQSYDDSIKDFLDKVCNCIYNTIISFELIDKIFGFFSG